MTRLCSRWGSVESRSRRTHFRASTRSHPGCRVDSQLVIDEGSVVDVFDPRLALLSLGIAAVASERVRKVIGQSIGYAAAGTAKVSGSVADAGRDIVDEARRVAGHETTSAPKQVRSRTKSATAA